MLNPLNTITMQTGRIGVTSDNIFPIIKKFLYSDHEIFLRELVSNAVDASQKIKTLASVGDFRGELGEVKVRVKVDKEAKTITVSDRGIGMTAEEIDKYINQIAFSSAEDFLTKYKDQISAIIGHFGLGFYSSFMVSKQVEIQTLSYQDGAKGVKWSCDGTPEYNIEEFEKSDRGTDIILHIDSESEEFLEESRISELLLKYCKFLPVEIAFGKETEWKDGKQVDTGKDKIINNPKPAWTQKPSDLKDEDYKKFYRELYPNSFDEPMFNIHLNVDYPFNLTGILYFPKIKTNFEIQKNKIQLYCNQVFVTDSVEGIVPDFLTLLHGVIDSPDIPLNVSRSYLQSDSNVKKISAHITKKVADRLSDLFKNERSDFEKKWDDLKMFIYYGIITDEKFYERAEKFTLLKNVDNKYFTIDEYKTLVKENQTDKDNKIVILYANNVIDQHTFIESAKAKGYDVVVMDGQLDIHYINNVETKLTDVRFTRVDSDVVEKLIRKDVVAESKIPQAQQEDLVEVFESQLSDRRDNYSVVFESMAETDMPVTITQSEFMRRMKDMSKLSGGDAGFYRNLPDSYNMVINANHPLVTKIMNDKDAKIGTKLQEIEAKFGPVEQERNAINEGNKDKKHEEIPQADQDKLHELEERIDALSEEKKQVIGEYAKTNKLVKQIIDLALLANNALKGEELTKFVKRSVELIEA